MQSTAKVIPIAEARSDAGYRFLPTLNKRVKGKGRVLCAKEMRELADKIERGELDGVRLQWRDTHSCLVEVVVDGQIREFDLLDAKAPQPPEGLPQQPISGMETVTRTAWSEDGSGEVKYQVTTIVEED